MNAKTLLKSVLGVCLLGASTLSSAATVLLYDDFATTSLNGSVWGQGTWPLGRTGFGNPVMFKSETNVNFMRLNLDTYNPSAPGKQLYGADVYSNQRFPVGATGLELEARVRATYTTVGQVASAFLFEYDTVNGGQDELDMEILTNKPTNTFLATGFNDWQAAFGYADTRYFSASMVTGPSGYSYKNWNTYKIRWYMDRVEWYLNGNLVRTINTPVPTVNLQVHMNFWAPNSDWTDAYSANLKPAAKRTSNVRYYYDVDYVKVTQL